MRLGDQQAAELAAGLLGGGSFRARRFGAGKFSEVFAVDAVEGDGRYVLRVAPPDDVLQLFYEYRMMRQEPAIHARLLAELQNEGKRMGLTLVGPYHAFLVQGKEDLGALVEVHRKLYHANINVYSSHGVTDGKSCYGYVLYVRPEKYEEAADVLGV